MGFVAIWAYLALAGFVVGCLYKAYHYATMPLHVRWELYPVAHEKGKVSYGGSYFEELDWWTKPREVSKLGEIKTIAEEVLTLKAVREHNPKLWLPSLLFHYGLYLLFTLGAALVAGAVARYVELPGLGFLGGRRRALSAWGAVALALATLGCIGLLARRSGQRASSATPRRRPTSCTCGCSSRCSLASWGSWVFADRRYEHAASFVAGLVTFRPTVAGRPAGSWRRSRCSASSSRTCRGAT